VINMNKDDKIKELLHRELCKRDFWEYCLYMDNDFYSERVKILKPIAYDMQRLIKPLPYQKELDILNVSLPPRTGKSYLTTMFCSWAFGHFPVSSIMRNSVTDTLYYKFSKDLIQIMAGQSHKGKYKHIFDIDFNTKAVSGWELKNSNQGVSYFGGGVGGTIIGFGADLLSILDDSVKNDEEALSDLALAKKWGWYTSTMDSRQEQGVKKLFIGTRWSLNDIVGRLENLGLFNGDKAKNIVIKALENGKSFCEDIHTTEVLLGKKLLLSDILWEAEWQQNPITVKGLVFPSDELKSFTLKEFNWDSVEDVFALVDTADEGRDFLSVPIIAKAGGEYYLIAVVFSTDREEIMQPIVAGVIDKHLPSITYIESNFNGKGWERQLELLTVSNSHYFERFRTVGKKHAKILSQAGFIRQNFNFRSDYEPGSEYSNFMINFTSYNKTGKVKHDDAPDSLAMFTKKTRSAGSIEFG